MADPKPRFNIWQIIIIFLMIESLTASNQSDSLTFVGSHHEEKCGKDNDCDLHIGLTCVANICQCGHQNMIYEHYEANSTHGRCFVKANSPCVPLTSEEEENLLPTTVVKSEFDYHPCVENSHCEMRIQHCLCDAGFLPTDIGTCASEIEPCVVSSDCKEEMGFICRDKICVCNPNTTLHVDYLAVRICVGKAGKPCVDEGCVENAECKIYDTSNLTTETVPALIPSKLCECTKNYFPTESGECSTDYDTDCSSRPCKPRFHCGIDSKVCECHDPLNEIYNALSDSCVAKINGTCNANFTNNYNPNIQTICTSGGECLKTSGADKQLSYRCRCKEGTFLHENSSTCELPFMSPCGSNSDHPNLICCPSLGLECVNGQCLCKENSLTIYDKTYKQCIGLVGAKCVSNSSSSQINNIIQSEMSTAVYVVEKCVKGATCQPVLEDANDLFSSSFCRCRILTQEGTDGMCMTGRGSQYFKNLVSLIVASLVVVFIGAVAFLCYLYMKKQREALNTMSNIN